MLTYYGQTTLLICIEIVLWKLLLIFSITTWELLLYKVNFLNHPLRMLYSYDDQLINR